jgi:hypothetical protein
MHPSFKTLAAAGTILASMAGIASADPVAWNYPGTNNYYYFNSDSGAQDSANSTPGAISYSQNGVYGYATGSLYDASEVWTFNSNVDSHSEDTYFALNNWGSPGAGGGGTDPYAGNYATYGGAAPVGSNGQESESAIGFAIFFQGGPALVPTAGSDCNGGTNGGTVYCNELGATITGSGDGVQWTATYSQNTNGDYGWVFMAPNSDAFQALSDTYYVNVFFNSSASLSSGGVPTSFTGAWIYPAEGGPSVPEPATLSIVGAGLVGLGAVRRRRRRA